MAVKDFEVRGNTVFVRFKRGTVVLDKGVWEIVKDCYMHIAWKGEREKAYVMVRYQGVLILLHNLILRNITRDKCLAFHNDNCLDLRRENIFLRDRKVVIKEAVRESLSNLQGLKRGKIVVPFCIFGPCSLVNFGREGVGYRDPLCLNPKNGEECRKYEDCLDLVAEKDWFGWKRVPIALPSTISLPSLAVSAL